MAKVLEPLGTMTPTNLKTTNERMKNTGIYVEVSLTTLEKLLEDLKATKLSLMYEFSGNFDKDRQKIQNQIDEYRLWLHLPSDPDPLKGEES